MHNREICNFVADRDVAAAMVMLNYARGLGTSLLNHGKRILIVNNIEKLE